MKRNNEMSQLIVDHVMLMYLHDLLSLRDKDAHFYDRDVYRVLTEPTLATILLGLRKSILSLIGFIALVFFLKMIYLQVSTPWQIVAIVLVVLHYGVTFYFFRREKKEIQYQNQLKKAAHYALKHYNYQEFVIFIDQYLSVKSSSVYFDSNIYHKV